MHNMQVCELEYYFGDDEEKIAEFHFINHLQT